MATIYKEISIRAPAEKAWAALADVGNAHKPFGGVLSDCRLEGDDVRIATFANGMSVKERIVSVDPARMRIVYSVIESGFVHHSASMQVIAASDRESRFTWITDVLPHEATARIGPLMDQGMQALKANLEKT
jgi:uncharacterized protein YndB with AHSA1/START domain